jgi:hypothetical protein
MAIEAKCDNCNHAVWDDFWGELKCKNKQRVCKKTELVMGCDNFEKRGTKPTDPKPEMVVRSGATYVPQVSEDGYLSWINDKGLINPDPVRLRGDKGETGEPGPKGEKGDTGEPGAKGQQGTVFVPSVDNQGVLTFTNSDGLPNPDPINIVNLILAELAATPNWQTGGTSYAYRYASSVDYIYSGQGIIATGKNSHYNGSSKELSVVPYDANQPISTTNDHRIGFKGWAIVNGGQDKYFWSINQNMWYSFVDGNLYDAEDPVLSAATHEGGLTAAHRENGRFDNLTADLSLYKGRTIPFYVAVRSSEDPRCLCPILVIEKLVVQP